eukprot:3314943-Pleurochrysis_carterae.AAC.4
MSSRIKALVTPNETIQAATQRPLTVCTARGSRYEKVVNLDYLPMLCQRLPHATSYLSDTGQCSLHAQQWPERVRTAETSRPL